MMGHRYQDSQEEKSTIKSLHGQDRRSLDGH